MKNAPTLFGIPMDESIMALGMLEADQLASGVDAPALATRRVAVLAGDGLDEVQFLALKALLEADGAQVNVVSNRTGPLRGLSGGEVMVDHHWLDMPSVMFDAVYIPGGHDSVDTLRKDPDALTFVQEAYEHGKSLAATGQGVGLLHEVMPEQAGEAAATGVVTDLHAPSLERVAEDFIAAIIKDRHWRRSESSADVLAAPASSLSYQGSTGLGPI
ncbi:MAG: hypothetical protein EOP36_15290 [Rubrivivax sp.]|nr:MAG: hypothetical protein EOP36_15290 [Rubrivivax sp.]